MDNEIQSVDELISLLEKYRGYKLDTIITTYFKVEDDRCWFPEYIQGKLKYNASCDREKELQLELIVEEDLTYVDRDEY